MIASIKLACPTCHVPVRSTEVADNDAVSLRRTCRNGHRWTLAVCFLKRTEKAAFHLATWTAIDVQDLRHLDHLGALTMTSQRIALKTSTVADALTTAKHLEATGATVTLEASGTFALADRLGGDLCFLSGSPVRRTAKRTPGFLEYQDRELGWIPVRPASTHDPLSGSGTSIFVIAVWTER